MKFLPLLIASLLLAAVLGAADSLQAQGDITPPSLVDLVIEPAHVNAATGPQTITITATFTDDLSGFDSALLVFQPAVGTTQFREVQFYGDQTSKTITLPQFAAEGWWGLSALVMVDIVGNRVNYSPTSSDGFPAHLRQYRFYNGAELPRQPEYTVYLSALSRNR